MLKSYDGISITYDGVGNPEDDGTWQYQWVHGRQLKKMTHKTTGETWDFTYNADGLRTKRTHTANGTTTAWEYVYNGSQLTQMKKGSDTLHFAYDASGTPMTVTHKTATDETTYYYVTNLQGDIVKLVDSTGTTVATYSYDAWGNPTNTPTGTIATLNPLRYRGYVYDPETGFYYLQSRYYNPQTGRFINADNNFSNYNLFMYCGNSPANRIDPNGEHWYYLWIDDLIEGLNELMASVSNIVYGRAAYERSFYDPKGAKDLWNSRPFQDIKPSTEMQIFTEFMYDHDFVADISISVSVPYIKMNVKVGASKVISPNKNINATYVHVGVGLSTPSVLPISMSYSVGIVNGVNIKEDYARHFLDIGAGAIYGFDYCFWLNGVSAYSFTLGTSYGVYCGYDYYWCID